MNNISLDDLTLAMFSDAVKTKFRLRLTATDVLEIELIETRAGRSGAPAPGQPRFESFSLLFGAPPERRLSQRLYCLEHDQIGRFELFLVPVGYGPGVAHYEAVFNRRARAS
jgi:hypothetical protein